MSQAEMDELVGQAVKIIRGQRKPPEQILTVAKGLKKYKKFTYARRILARAREDLPREHPKYLEIYQQSALCTYKDMDLPADARLEMALGILRRAEDLTATVNQETLGIAGSIFKQKWELDNQPQHLSRALSFYRRGYERGINEHNGKRGIDGDNGYTAINTAYTLDLLAHLEIKDARSNLKGKCEEWKETTTEPAHEESAAKVAAESSVASESPAEVSVAAQTTHAHLTPTPGNGASASPPKTSGRQAEHSGGMPASAASRIEEGQRIRREIIKKLPALAEERAKEIEEKKKQGCTDLPADLVKQWWYYSTLGEAHFGLGDYDEAVKRFRNWHCQNIEVNEWEYEATARQLTNLARLQVDLRRWQAESESPNGCGARERKVKGEEAAAAEQDSIQKALQEILGVNDKTAESLFRGKFGLALSGGGFRASLFHIGVLARLAEHDLLRHVQVLSCVSGGSIVGAYYYLELRKCLSRKPDGEVKAEDYVEIVERIAENFLKGVQQNIRTRVIAEFTTNLKMLFWPNYSRTLRVGELYERELYSRIDDDEGQRPRWINQLYISPKDEQADFRPNDHNWRRRAKVPNLILNAATLNTGHSWHFTASYMGEPPAGINSEIDGNDRLRRMYYSEAPPEFRQVRLGHAVAASSCVPGLFEPLMFKGLYPDRVVRLVDGGVCDNQGVSGLLEQDCNVILVSDGSGHVETEADSSSSPLRNLLRSNNISMARVREAQYHELAARRRTSLLRGLMFVHLKQDLDVDPVDWVDCPDPFDATDAARPASRRGSWTRYGVAKDVQKLLAAVRTDLDSFSEAEAYALMASGYRMTQFELEENKCVEGFDRKVCDGRWKFLDVEHGMKDDGHRKRYMKRLLGAGSSVAFKVWRLAPVRSVLLLLMLLLPFFVAGWFYRGEALALLQRWFGRAAGITLEQVGRWFGYFVAGLVTTALLTNILIQKFGKGVGRGIMRGVKWRDTLIRVGLGVFMCLAGFILARIHLHLFDRMYLSLGRLDKLRAKER